MTVKAEKMFSEYSSRVVMGQRNERREAQGERAAQLCLSGPMGGKEEGWREGMRKAERGGGG